MSSWGVNEQESPPISNVVSVLIKVSECVFISEHFGPDKGTAFSNLVVIPGILVLLKWYRKITDIFSSILTGTESPFDLLCVGAFTGNNVGYLEGDFVDEDKSDSLAIPVDDVCIGTPSGCIDGDVVGCVGGFISVGYLVGTCVGAENVAEDLEGWIVGTFPGRGIDATVICSSTTAKYLVGIFIRTAESIGVGDIDGYLAGACVGWVNDIVFVGVSVGYFVGTINDPYLCDGVGVPEVVYNFT